MERAGAGFASSSRAVVVVSSTWARDSHDLFDFEAHHLHTKTFTVLKPMVCVRTGTDVQMFEEHAQLPAGSEPLLRLVQKEGSFWVDKVSPSNSSKKLWLVVHPSSHRLAEGDVIKLGRFKFRVRQLVASPSGGTQPELRLDDSGVVQCPNSARNRELATTLCRICLLEGSTDDDPLICPCQCKGSIEFIHLGCLRHWIRGRLNLSDNTDGSYFYRPLACELCKAVYPAYVHVQHERSPLVEVPRTVPPFIVLENMVHATRGLHVISLAEKVLKLGRGHESDVRIADVSISRCHAMVRFHRGYFVLEDNNSKFGTLVAMKKPRMLEPGSSISIQMGRTVLGLSVQPDIGCPDSAPLFQLPGSSAQDERALRLSLLTRGNTRADGGPHTGGAGSWRVGGGGGGGTSAPTDDNNQHDAAI
mmetsp:Transcript_47756/g.134859  ORF Transcript_47756/g.134859 Transcript_47756/m.134859 type:complete len:418 (-) Transcript_47756:97-1350(-)